jgi:small subunit ribosomal protein S2
VGGLGQFGGATGARRRQRLTTAAGAGGKPAIRDPEQQPSLGAAALAKRASRPYLHARNPHAGLRRPFGRPLRCRRSEPSDPIFSCGGITGKEMDMALPEYSMRQLLEAGVHFGHHTRRWNPKMSPYIFGVRNGIHIIDLEQSVPLLRQGLEAVREVVAGGGRVLFVGTKRQAQDAIADAAKRCGQYFVNYRWLGGMLTNFKTISLSIKRLRELEERITNEQSGLTKRELLELTRDRDKLERALGGIKEMGGLPDILFVIDTNKEAIAVAEANKLRVPVVAILDSNSSPDGIAYPIPGNDDAMRAIHMYCDLVSGAVLDGLQAELTASGIDIGARAVLPSETVADEPAEDALPGEAAPPELDEAETAAEAAPTAH